MTPSLSGVTHELNQGGTSASSLSTKPPTDEIGSSTQYGSGVPGWNQYVGDDLERAPQLQWPNSVHTYAQMRHDAQVQGLYLGTTLPLRRYHWVLDPNGCDPKMVELLAADLNLQVKGNQEQTHKKRARGRFIFKKHMQDAMLALLFGHYPFEQVGAYREDNTDIWHLTKLAPRPPETLSSIELDDSGDLTGITQYYSQYQSGRAVPIPANRLVWYAWMMEGANWPGRSMLRACYRNWLRKDRLLRVDANKQERNGMGIPIAEGAQGASGPALERLDRMMRRLRSGDTAGGSVPFGSNVKLLGTTGTLPDTLASIKLDNEEMARAWLAMFMQLGQTETGSRALGSEFIDFFSDAVDEMGYWFADTFTEHVIEDWWDWNVGEDEDATPLLTFTRNPDSAFVVRDFANFVKVGAITVDEGLENAIRERVGLPPRDPSTPPPSMPVPGDSGGWPSNDELESPEVPPPPSSAPGTTDGATATARRGRPARAAEATSSPVSLPARPLRRQLYPQEIQAAVDWSNMDTSWQLRRDTLVQSVRNAQHHQIQELHDQIVEAGNDLGQLGSIQATPNMQPLIHLAMADMAVQGARDAQTEASRQGASIALPNADDLRARQQPRAEAVDQMLANALSASARTNALRFAGGKLTGAEIADSVRTKLQNLSNSYLQDQLGGALTAAMNSGRRATIEGGSPTRIYASELLDDNTCAACISEDGTEFLSIDDAEKDYSSGGFNDCFGGPRCRGTLIAVYGEESVATIE